MAATTQQTALTVGTATAVAGQTVTGFIEVPGASDAGWLAALPGLALAICMLSLAGIPPTAGFVSKLTLFGAAINADYTVNRLHVVGATRASLTTHLLGVETRLAANPRLQVVSFVQWNTVVRQLSSNVRLAWEYRPLSFFTVVYNDRSAVDGRGATIPAPARSRQLLMKLTWLWQL